jgi:outer membrane receptor protein involved in Fe transport
VLVQGERQGGDAASRLSVGRRELELRPRLRPGDVLEAVPGLFAVQHAGGGKANQYFLRGFDADHGTDIAFFVDGVPVNNVSHGHGQGFTDFHFLIPELVVGLDGYKGPYYAQFGNFATAGAVNLRLAEKFEESYAQYSVGQYGIMRGLVIASPDVGETWRAVLAAEVYKNDGPFVNPEQLKRFNAYARLTHDLGPSSKVAMTWMSYGSSWVGSGQIPARAVCGEGEAQNAPPEAFGEKCIDRFGYIDPTEGGASQRHMLSLAYNTSSHDADLSSLVYALKYKFRLFSNFTFFDQDPTRGDEIEQNDERVVLGGDFRARRHFHYGPSKFTTSFGLQARHDSIDNSLYHDERRVRLDERAKSHIAESNVGVYLEEDMRLTPWLRLVVGARADRIDVNVDDTRTARPAGELDASGFRGAVRVSPKFLAMVSPVKELDLFANYGRGFHSNDARGVVLRQGGATLMTPAVGYELGARFKPTRDLYVQADAFLMDLESELVWSGDEGTTSPSGSTRRYGVEVSGRYRLSNWLFADADLTFVRPRYRENGGNGEAVALAPTRTVTAGIAARPTYGDYTPFAAARIKHLADRPAIEDRSLTAEGFTTVDANVGLRRKNVEVAVDVQNVFNATWREVNFASDTRLPYEPATVSGIHYSPGWPRTVVGRVALYWQ